MGWDRKKRGATRGYYYRSVRDGDRTRKIYLGKSAAAEEVAAAVTRRRDQRDAGTRALRKEAESTVEADRSAAELREWTEVIASAWLVLTGHHFHHGFWRYRQMAKRAPREGSKAWDEALYKNPTFIKNMIAGFAKDAARGDASAAENLEQWLSRYPEYRPVVPQMRDLTEKVEGIWIRMVSGGDKAAEQGTTEEVAKVKAELLGSVEGGAGILEKLLASSIAVNYLVQQHALARLADKTEHLAVAASRENRMTAAQKRFHGSVKMWELLKEKKANGMSPPSTVGFFAAETANQTATPNPEAEESTSPPSPDPSRRPKSTSRKVSSR